MPPKPARPKLADAERRATSHTRERAELQRLALDFVVHELGNAAAPILMVAEMLDRDGTGANVTRSARSMRATAANLREIAAAVRYFRGDPGSERLTPAAFSDTGTWWRRLAPLFAACLPRSVRLSEEVNAVTAEDQTLAALTWCTLGSLRLIGSALPEARIVAVSCERTANSGVTIRFDVSADLPVALTAEAKRWRRFVTWEAHAAGARFTIDAALSHTALEVSL